MSAQDWMVFAVLTHRKKLLLPNAPHAFGVTGLLSVILYVLRGGLLIKKSWLASLTRSYYLSALASELATPPNKKIPHFVQDFFICALCWT